MLPELKVLNAAGSVLAQGNGVLCYEPAYQPGDVLELTVPQPGYHVICLDDAMGEELVFFQSTVFRLEVPFEEAHISYSPRAFAGEMHYLTARSATVAEISAPRNLARNRYDHHDNIGIFPMLGPMWRQEANLYLQPGTPLMGSYTPPATDAIRSRVGGSIVTQMPAGCWTSGGLFRPIRWC